MKIETRITDLTEAQVEALTQYLMDAGLEHDVDFTTLYGKGYEIKGLILLGGFWTNQTSTVTLLQDSGLLDN